MVKTWSQLATILVNSSFRAKELPSSNARSNSSLLRFGQWTASGTSYWDPPANGTRLLVTTMWRPLNCPSLSAPVDTSSVPDTPGIVSASPKNKTGNEPLIWQNLQCRNRELPTLKNSRERTPWSAFHLTLFSLEFPFWSPRANLKLGARHVCPRQFTLTTMNHGFSWAIVH